MNHVSDAGNQPKDAVRNFLVKPNGLAVLYDAILRACHDHDWHRQFLIAMPHGQGDRDHRDAVLTLCANLPWSYGHAAGKALRETCRHGERGEHPLEQEWQYCSANERGD